MRKKIINVWEMLINVLRVLINNLFKENFYEKRKQLIF